MNAFLKKDQENLTIPELQNKYQTKIHIGRDGRIYSYQCVPVLNEAIVAVCNKMETTISFTN